MLHTETVEQSTLELLVQLQKQEYLSGFHLVGGTALALKMGHRKSIDIDLFSDFSFDVGSLLENLSADFSFNLFFSAKNTIKGNIDKVQLDILAHRYPLINAPTTINNISMLSTEDIIAMKLNAISTSGQRVKDFIDIYFLLDFYSIEEMLSFYKKKYSQYNEVIVLKSIIWFEDVELSEWPVLLKNPNLTWSEVKEKITKATNLFFKTL
jgi:hypothetical protein